MKAKITYLGGEETGDVGRVTWGEHSFELNKAVEVTDAHIIEKAKTNKFFKVEMMKDEGTAAAPDHDEEEDDEKDDGDVISRPASRPVPGRPPSRSR